VLMLTKADLNRPFVGESGHPDYPMFEKGIPEAALA
jgi:hypothetical protein